jgi:transcriptional regulator with XRE-family HTH domain
MYHYFEEDDEPCTDTSSAESDFADLPPVSRATTAGFDGDEVAERSVEFAERSDRITEHGDTIAEYGSDDLVEQFDEVAEVAGACCSDCAAGRVTGPVLHRLAEVRQMQHITVREAQRYLHLSPEEVRQQERPDCDLRLSELYAWQQLLGVPIAELFADPGLNLSPPIQKRAEMVKLMKTAATLVEKATQPNLQALAKRLVEQLLEVMPELKGVNPWPSVGVRRTKLELGRAAMGIRLPNETLGMLLSGE